MNILIVEDDPMMVDAIGMTLRQKGYHTLSSRTIETALYELKYNQIDGVILDLNLPDGDGNRLARLIRARHKSHIPILIVSGKNTVDDRITALGAGADGYLTKPFDKYELVANLEAIMRRAHGHASALVTAGNLTLDLTRNITAIDGTHLALTRKEYQMLHLLLLSKGSVLSKDTFLTHLYGGIDEPEAKIIDVFICKLRRKLIAAGIKGATIETIWGQGYVITTDKAETDTYAESDIGAHSRADIAARAGDEHRSSMAELAS